MDSRTCYIVNGNEIYTELEIVLRMGKPYVEAQLFLPPGAFIPRLVYESRTSRAVLKAA